MAFIIILLVLIIIGGTVGILYVLNYNRMQYLNTKINKSLTIIDETLIERFNLIEKASDIIKNSIDENKDYLKEYSAIKNKNISIFEKDKKINEAFELIETLKSDNKSLSDNKDLKKISKSIKETNEKLSAIKNYFNKNTKENNELIKKFPSNFVAKIHKYKLSQLFEANDINKYDIK